MGIPKFVLILVALAMVSAVILKLGDILGYLLETKWLYTVTVGFFTIFSFLMYFLSHKASKSTNKSLFIQVVMLGVLAKMIFAASLIFLYRERVKPIDNWFLAYIAIIYFIYTIFEVNFMSRLGSQSAKDIANTHEV